MYPTKNLFTYAVFYFEKFEGVLFTILRTPVTCMEGQSGQKEHFLILINDLLILINDLLILINDLLILLNDFLILLNDLLILINGMIY